MMKEEDLKEEVDAIRKEDAKRKEEEEEMRKEEEKRKEEWDGDWPTNLCKLVVSLWWSRRWIACGGVEDG